jgi:hypothetical protein
VARPVTRSELPGGTVAPGRCDTPVDDDRIREVSMDLFLDVFFEGEADEAFARRAKADLVAEVGRLAPHTTLNVDVLPATDTKEWRNKDVQGQWFNAWYHEPSVVGRQSLLITDRDIGAVEGRGTAGYAVVSMKKMVEKERGGGYSVDIVIHEWIHTLCDIEINGHRVPFVDCAKEYDFKCEWGPNGQDRWTAWYRYCLGAREDQMR